MLKHYLVCRFVTKAFGTEQINANQMLTEVTDTLRVLTFGLQKNLKYFHRSGDDEDTNMKMQFATVTKSLIEAAEQCEKHLAELEEKVRVLDVSAELAALRKVCKQAKKAGKNAKEKLNVGDMDQKEAESKLKEEAEKVKNAVFQQKYLEWTTGQHINEWRQVIHARNPEAGAHLEKVLLEYKIDNISELVVVDAAKVRKTLKVETLTDDQKMVLHEVNRIRSHFWGVWDSKRLAIRNAWLLVREQFLRIEDLKLIYSVLQGSLSIPPYWKSALVDGLELMTEGLLTTKPLTLEKVPGTMEYTRWDGSKRKQNISRYFFTDGEFEEGTQPQKKKLGPISAETTARMIMQLRDDMVELIGWGGKDGLAFDAPPDEAAGAAEGHA